MAGRDREAKTKYGILSLSLIIALWAGLSLAKRIPELFLPSPGLVWATLIELAGRLPSDIAVSLAFRAIPGFIIGCGLGVATGLLMGRNKVVEGLLDPIIEVLRPLPPLALIPLFILWFGIEDDSKIMLISFGCFVIMVVTTVEAVKNVAPIYVQAAQVLGANERQIFRTIILPAILPGIFGGIRVAAAASFGLDVASEFMGAESGLGYLLIVGRRFLRTEVIFVVLIVITFLSLLIDRAIRAINWHFTKWMERM